MDHKQARYYVIEGYRIALGHDSEKVSELQCLQGVCLLETRYGEGWKGAGIGSNNMGAVQSRNCEEYKTFPYTDTHPNPDGTSSTYTVCFKKYLSKVEGFTDVAKIMYSNMIGVRTAAMSPSGNLYLVSEALYANHYYEGWGTTREQRISHHYASLIRAVNAIAYALNEKMPDQSDTLGRVLKLQVPPMKGRDVAYVQTRLGIDADGWFGPKTKRAVMNFQTAKGGLQVDGVVGLDTWRALHHV